MTVLAHPVEDIRDEILEPLLYVLADGAFRDVWVFPCQAVTYLNSQVMECRRNIGP